MSRLIGLPPGARRRRCDVPRRRRVGVAGGERTL